MEQRIYVDDGGLGRLTGRDRCERGRLLRGSSSRGGEQERARTGTAGPIAPPAEESCREAVGGKRRGGGGSLRHTRRGGGGRGNGGRQDGRACSHETKGLRSGESCKEGAQTRGSALSTWVAAEARGRGAWTADHPDRCRVGVYKIVGIWRCALPVSPFPVDPGRTRTTSPCARSLLRLLRQWTSALLQALPLYLGRV